MRPSSLSTPRALSGAAIAHRASSAPAHQLFHRSAARRLDAPDGGAVQRQEGDALSGVVVKEPEEVLQVVSEGGGMQQFGSHVRKVTVRVNTHEQLLPGTP